MGVGQLANPKWASRLFGTAKESAFRKNDVLSFMPNLPQFAAILASPSKPIGDLAPNGTIRSRCCESLERGFAVDGRAGRLAEIGLRRVPAARACSPPGVFMYASIASDLDELCGPA
jgi:hypothetical protein